MGSVQSLANMDLCEIMIHHVAYGELLTVQLEVFVAFGA